MSSTSVDYTSDKPRWITTPAPNRRLIFAVCASLTLAALFALVGFSFWTSYPSSHARLYYSSRSGAIFSEQLPSELLSHIAVNDTVLDPLDPLASLMGPPTRKFRDNLRNDKKYLTSWISAGWTNDVMTYGNLIYLALITDRIPIVGMFTPSHVNMDGPAASVPFGDVFDVPRLRKLLNKPVLEWRDVKEYQNNPEIEELGCWSTWQAVQLYEAHPRGSTVTQHLNLDVSYTRMPTWIKLIPNFPHDQHSTFWSLAAFAYPEARAANLVPPTESPNHKVLLPPDEHLVCYDYLYYSCASQPYEYDMDFSPAWRYVGQHMRWTQSLEDLADIYVRRTIGVQEGDPTPPWISIHLRHGDFSAWCGDVPTSDCFASLDIVGRRVREVQEELLARKGLDVKHVIMTSDEKNSTWWDDVIARGWLAVDHTTTMTTYGVWYPVFIDAVIQSNGVGFVGTDRSTMTTLARRRVQSWHDGAVRVVKWGRADSDNH